LYWALVDLRATLSRSISAESLAALRPYGTPLWKEACVHWVRRDGRTRVARRAGSGREVAAVQSDTNRLEPSPAGWATGATPTPPAPGRRSAR
jgi:hypothetical protein